MHYQTGAPKPGEARHAEGAVFNSWMGKEHFDLRQADCGKRNTDGCWQEPVTHFLYQMVDSLFLNATVTFHLSGT